VLLALGSAYIVIWRLSHDDLALPAGTVPPAAVQPQALDRAHTIKGLAILGVVIVLLFTSLPKELVALTAAGVHLASPKYRTQDLLKLVDWPLLVLFMSLFVVTGAFEAAGYGDRVVEGLAQARVNLQSPTVLVLATTALSNLINNAAAVMLLLKLPGVTQPPDAYVLALANSFGGSLLLVGSVSNIIVVQQARELGIRISFRQYARLGVPVTLVALLELIGWVMVTS